MTPMMVGLLVTGIASGLLISRYGRYRPFPIIGTAVVGRRAVPALAGSACRRRLGGGRVPARSSGSGSGMVMQVLVLAAQNAVDYRLLGVATSGASLARQIGGSIGVSVFGAIFTNRLGHELAQRVPPGVHVAGEREPAARPPAAARDPRAVRRGRLPSRCTRSSSPRPRVMVGAFGLSWLLRDVPLRETAGAAGIGESLTAAGEAGSQHSSSQLQLGHPAQRLAKLSGARRRARSRARGEALRRQA